MLKEKTWQLYIFWGVILIVFPLPLVQLLNIAVEGIFSPTRLVMIDFGVTAYCYWLMAVLLSTRPLWIDKLIGLPKMYFVHSFLGIMAIILGFLHLNGLDSMSSNVRLTGNIAFYLEFFELLYASLFLSGWLVERLPVVEGLKNSLQHFFKHELSVWIHRLNLVVIILIWVHVHLIFQVNGKLEFMLLFDAYTLVTLGMYSYNKLLSSPKTSIGTIIENKPLNGRINQISIKIDNLKENPQPGSFYFLSFRKISGLTREFHPFSITNVPDQNNILIFIIQKTGDFTGKIDLVKPGTTVKLEGPFGQFNEQVERSNDPLILLGMGSGISPLLGMAEKPNINRNVHLLWSVSKDEPKYYQSRIKNLKINQIDVKERRFDTEYLTKKLTEEEIKYGNFFVVGNPRAVINIEHLLKGMNISSNRIFDEKLTM